MGGKLIYLMGPSCSGKDSILRGLSPFLKGKAVILRRFVTRPGRNPCEKHFPIKEDLFILLKESGFFSLDWQSHGLRYGLGPELGTLLEGGFLVLANGSRTYLGQAQKRIPSLIPVLIRVSPELLASRLMARGRESGEDLEERLRGADLFSPSMEGILEIDNSGSLDKAVSALYAICQRELESLA
jgi:ribose 1,5-bisphosphokinase